MEYQYHRQFPVSLFCVRAVFFNNVRCTYLYASSSYHTTLPRISALTYCWIFHYLAVFFKQNSCIYLSHCLHNIVSMLPWDISIAVDSLCTVVVDFTIAYGSLEDIGIMVLHLGQRPTHQTHSINCQSCFILDNYSEEELLWYKREYK